MAGKFGWLICLLKKRNIGFLSLVTQTPAWRRLHNNTLKIICCKPSHSHLRFCIVDPTSPQGKWQIFLSAILHNKAIRWYHLGLRHAGMYCTYDTMKQHYFHTNLCNWVEHLIGQFEACQHSTNIGCRHGHTAPCEVVMQLWYQVAMDSIGAWCFCDFNGKNHVFCAFKMIDTSTNLTDFIWLNSSGCLSCWIPLLFLSYGMHLQPRQGFHFRQVLLQHGIQCCLQTVKNQHAKVICKQMHQAI